MNRFFVAGVVLLHLGMASPGDAALLVNPSGGLVLFDDSVFRDDVVTEPRAIGFAFPFFDPSGEPVTHVTVSSNGNLNFDGNASYQNLAMDEEGNIARISPLWDDLAILPQTGDRIVEKVEAGVFYSVTWTVHEPTNGASQHVFQVVLFGSAIRLANVDFRAGDIVFAYERIGPSLSKGEATVGLESGDGLFTPSPAADPATGIVTTLAATQLTAGSGFHLFRFDEEETQTYTLPIALNTPPLAVDDVAFSTGGTLVIAALANDTDLNGHTLTLHDFGQGATGTVTASPEGSLIYQPATGFNGSDEFIYRVRDELGAITTGRVRILPFSAARGRYEGLMGEDPDPEFPEGVLRARVGVGGQVTGTFALADSEPLAFDGSFDATGYFQKTVPGEEGVNYAVSLRLGMEAGAMRMVGTVDDLEMPYPVIAVRLSNAPPVARDDIHYIRRRAPATIAVRANDADPDGDAVTVRGFGHGAAGKVSLNSNGTLRYTPDPSFTGRDRFSYEIVDESGLPAMAHVTLLPVAVTKGVYDGLTLLTDEDGALVMESSGFLKVTIGAGGAFTVVLGHGGYRIPVRGHFNEAGDFVKEVVRTDGKKLTVTLRLDLLAASDQLTGSISDGDSTSLVTAGRSQFHAQRDPAPQAGKYTALLPADLMGGPVGHGYALMKITKNGRATVRGKLGDGTPFTFGSAVRRNGTLPLYLRLYPGKGLAQSGCLFGTLQFADRPNESDFHGALTWHKPEPLDAATADEEPGFTATIEMAGARYLAPDAGGAALNFGETGAGTLDIDGDSVPIRLAGGQRVIVEEAEKPGTVVRLKPGSGLFTGSFIEESTHPVTGRMIKMRRTFSGALLQEQNRGAGVFVGAQGSGYVTLDPAF